MKFYDQVRCRQCFLLIKNCECYPIPCPFCSKLFQFTQDWNVHLIDIHEIEKTQQNNDTVTRIP